ncbi:MAG: hypothetical protein WCF12_04215 [Propionicimonas sp.]
MTEESPQDALADVSLADASPAGSLQIASAPESQAGEAAGDDRLPDWTLPDVSTLDPAVLERLVTHLTRVTPEGRRKAAQDPATRMYLQAGLRLLEQQVTAPREEPPADDDRHSQPHPFLTWLSRNRVAAETLNEPEDSGLPRKGTQAGLRDRWEPHSDFLADVLAVALTADNWGKAVTDNDTLWDALGEHPDFVRVVSEVAYLDLAALDRAAGFRIQLLAAAMAGRDEVVRSSLRGLYQSIIQRRAAMYAAVFEARGLRLRPGFTFAQMSELLSALTEGLALRLVVDGDAPVIDHGSRESLLGLGAFALMAATVDFTGDGQPVDAFFRGAFGQGAAADQDPTSAAG